ncbi:MAG: alpha/beta hydrolase [Azonexus sp.]|nr:alpha/beta hydrolase [Azonexus sp.]MCK6413752.1 alpha/beta hydrolase [Azonexus sp.]
MQQVEVLGLRLEYRDFPATRSDLPPLVLLHEGLGSVAMWRDFPQKLAAASGARVVVFSRAGYGGSDAYAEPRTPHYMHREGEQMLPAFLAALGIERPLLVGHSDGGSIALICAGAHPELAAGLVVMAPHEFVEEITLAGIRAAREVWQTSDWRDKLGRYHRDPVRVFHDWNDAWLAPEFRDWNIEDYLPRIACPVLALQGEDDEYATMRQIEVIGAVVPGAAVLKLPACGHSPQRDQEAAVLAAIVGFAERLSGSCR